MPVDDVLKFFENKRPWSRYKDSILDYYLKPYLAKVARLRRPIAIVDCFAGAGKFGGGEDGSPLIIGKRLEDVHRRGIQVVSMFIEANATLFDELSKNVQELSVPVILRKGAFRPYVDEIAKLATTHTMFVYVDPIKPGDLRFADLGIVYDKLRERRSVETLINFISTGFVRRAEGLRERAMGEGVLDTQHDEVIKCNDIAGGDYWQEIAFDSSLDQEQKIEKIAQGYSQSLDRWFLHRLVYPVREKYEDVQPKYHLVFGSRHPHALELMNRAMIAARRESVGAQFVDGMLFPNEPAKEVIDEHDVQRLIVDTAREIGRTTWESLRVRATIAEPCKYTDSDLNRAIKKAIIARRIMSTAAGTKIENFAKVWPTSEQ